MAYAKKTRLWLAVIAVGCFFAGIYLGDYHGSSDLPIVAESPAPQFKIEDLLGQRAPSFQLMDAAGDIRDVAEWQGSVVVVNFWATWCPPCLEEIPEFIALQEKYADQGVQFVGISLDSAEAVAVFANKLGVNYPLLVGGSEVIKLAQQFGNHFGGLPYTVIVDCAGVIRFIKQGRLLLSEAEAEIMKVLSQS